MNLDSRFKVIGNKIHFSFNSFAGYIEAVIGSASLWYKTSITKDGENFSTVNHSKLEDAFEFVEEYSKQLEIERS